MTDNQKATVMGLIGLFFGIGWILGYWTAIEVYKKHVLETQEGFYDSATRTFKYKIMDEDSSM